MKKFKLLILSVIIMGMFIITSQAAYKCTTPDEGATGVRGTWTQTEHGLRFTAKDGQEYVNHWLYYKDGEWYYFNQDGYAVTGFQVVDGEKRYFDESSGKLQQGRFVNGGSLYFAAGRGGKLRTSLNGGNDHAFKYGGVHYVFDAEGRATNPEGKWDPDTLKDFGQAASNGATWKKENGNWVYYENGVQLFNAWHEEGGEWFYFDEHGVMVTSAVKDINGAKYSFNDMGVMETSGQKLLAGDSYTINADGTLTLLKSKEQAEAEKKLANDYALDRNKQHLNQIANPYNDNPVVQWFNATYAILTKGNGENIKAVGGMLKLAGVDGFDAAFDEHYAKQFQRLLASQWGVTDRASADSVLYSLLLKGNAGGSAWDYSRAMSNLGYYYIAGYYTIEETLDKSLEIALVIQQKFSSWDDFVNSYLKGYSDWSGKSETERREVYKKLKESAFNPFALDWNMKLQKNW